MPDVCGAYSATQSPVICGPWSVTTAIGPDARPVRLTQLVPPPSLSDDVLAAAQGTFERIVTAATTSPAPPSVLAVLAGGLQDGVFWLAEEAPGVASVMDAVSSSGPMAVEQVSPFMHALAAALDPLHAAGLYHGWLNPRNVYPDGASVRVGGWIWPFVMARLAGSGAFNSWPEIEFVAPEMRAGSLPNARAEVYSAAALAAFAISGEPVCPANLPPALAHALRTGLAIEPASRYDGVKQMIVDVTVEQAIAMTDQAEINAVPLGGDVPDWAHDLLAETTARREAGRPLVDTAPEAPPPPVPETRSPAPPLIVMTTSVTVEPSAHGITQPEATPSAGPGSPVFEWNVGEQEKRSKFPLIVSILSVLFVILGIALTVVHNH